VPAWAERKPHPPVSAQWLRALRLKASRLGARFPHFLALAPVHGADVLGHSRSNPEPGENPSLQRKPPPQDHQQPDPIGHSFLLPGDNFFRARIIDQGEPHRRPWPQAPEMLSSPTGPRGNLGPTWASSCAATIAEEQNRQSACSVAAPQQANLDHPLLATSPVQYTRHVPWRATSIPLKGLRGSLPGGFWPYRGGLCYKEKRGRAIRAWVWGIWRWIV
jgi:hypothetical protein